MMDLHLMSFDIQTIKLNFIFFDTILIKGEISAQNSLKCQNSSQ